MSVFCAKNIKIPVISFAEPAWFPSENCKKFPKKWEFPAGFYAKYIKNIPKNVSLVSVCYCKSITCNKNKKNKKKWWVGGLGKGKILFLQSQNGAGRWDERRAVRGWSSLKEWRNVANTQEEEFEDSQAMGSGQTNKKKRLIIMESLILAQDERWRQA